jgi:hypothetical protein
MAQTGLTPILEDFNDLNLSSSKKTAKDDSDLLLTASRKQQEERKEGKLKDSLKIDLGLQFQ